MSMMKHIQTWLLMVVVAVGSSMEVNAKTASGLQSIKSGLYVWQNGLQAAESARENYDGQVRCTSGVRYVTSDPMGLSDGPSTYNYVHGNPVNSYDPNGLSSVSACAMPANIPSCVAAGIIGGAALDGGINVGLQAYNKGWSCIDWDEARGAAAEGELWGLAGFGAVFTIAKYGGRLTGGLGRGFRGMADDVSEIPTKFYKPNGGSDASGFISTHSQKHLYNPSKMSKKSRSQFREDVNVRELVKDTIKNPDNAFSDISSRITKYSKSYDFNISTKHSPTGEMRVFINNVKPKRSTQFPYVPPSN